MTSRIDIPEHTGTLASGATRIVPERTRHDWETQWLRQNRDAVRTIENPHRLPASVDRERPPPTTAGVAASSGRAGLQPSLRHTGDDVIAATASPPSRPSWQNLHGPAVTAHMPQPVSLPVPPRIAASVYPAPEAAPASPPQRRAAPGGATPKRFGLWRDGDAVTLSLRTDGKQPPPALTSLRRWLRGLGLTLRAVIVNGLQHEQPPHDAHPVPDNHQEFAPWQ